MSSTDYRLKFKVTIRYLVSTRCIGVGVQIPSFRLLFLLWSRAAYAATVFRDYIRKWLKTGLDGALHLRTYSGALLYQKLSILGTLHTLHTAWTTTKGSSIFGTVSTQSYINQHMCVCAKVNICQG